MDKNNATQHKEFIFTCESDLDPELMQPSKTLCLSCDCGEHKYPFKIPQRIANVWRRLEIQPIMTFEASVTLTLNQDGQTSQ